MRASVTAPACFDFPMIISYGYDHAGQRPGSIIVPGCQEANDYGHHNARLKGHIMT